jgi:predicted TIM-barrel fold metal-dependent hydrolase
MPSDAFLTVDADGHVLEPRDVWQRYLEPKYRDDAIRIERDAEGVECLLVENKVHPALRGTLGALGGIEMDSTDLMTVGSRSYEDGCPPGGYDPAARLAVMDDEKIDVVLLYPTIGIAWEGLVETPELATAYCRAYNRWLVDFCSHDRRRLVPIAHICLKDPVGAVEEVKRARQDGCAGVYLSPDPVSRSGRQFDDPALAPFWETVQDLDMPIAFHVVARHESMLQDYLGGGDPRAGGGGVVCQAACVRTTFWWLPGTVSSSVKPRPSATSMPSIGKKDGVTRMDSTRCVSPASPTVFPLSW